MPHPRVVVVTGAGRGIGVAISRAFAARGDHLVLASRTAAELESTCAKLEQECGAAAIAVPTDVSDRASVEALIERALSHFGRVDVLVNNAGVTGRLGLLERSDPGDWARTVAVNLFGTMYATRAVIAPMREQGGGRIINVAGGGVGGAGLAARMSAYVVSKAAIVEFTEAMSKELAEYRIRINAVAPGAVVTEMTAGIIKEGPEVIGKELYERTVAQRESGGEPPENMANVVAWLGSDAAGELTGKFLSAKWDRLSELDIPSANKSSLYTLRRIDEVLFREVSKK
jgi:NAD(P)-dependent dehydrogenase (short-subunit alcohol dehydrogenase family)